VKLALGDVLLRSSSYINNAAEPSTFFHRQGMSYDDPRLQAGSERNLLNVVAKFQQHTGAVAATNQIENLINVCSGEICVGIVPCEWSIKLSNLVSILDALLRDGYKFAWNDSVPYSLVQGAVTAFVRWGNPLTPLRDASSRDLDCSLDITKIESPFFYFDKLKLEAYSKLTRRLHESNFVLNPSAREISVNVGDLYTRVSSSMKELQKVGENVRTTVYQQYHVSAPLVTDRRLSLPLTLVSVTVLLVLLYACYNRPTWFIYTFAIVAPLYYFQVFNSGLVTLISYIAPKFLNAPVAMSRLVLNSSEFKVSNLVVQPPFGAQSRRNLFECATISVKYNLYNIMKELFYSQDVVKQIGRVSVTGLAPCIEGIHDANNRIILNVDALKNANK
jgi:hypothetical protein